MFLLIRYSQLKLNRGTRLIAAAFEIHSGSRGSGFNIESFTGALATDARVVQLVLLVVAFPTRYYGMLGQDYSSTRCRLLR